MLASRRCGADPFGCAVPVTCCGRQKALSHAWRSEGVGRAARNSNALKHGAYTKEALARRAAMRTLIGEAKKLLNEIS
jgi:glucans biosynthesis protein